MNPDIQIDFERILKDCYAQFPLRNNRWTDHGPAHWKQVERNAIYLAQRTPGADLLVCRLFALTHDCQRQNEHDDPNHGSRAARYFAGQRLVWHLQMHLTASQYEKLINAVTYHNDGMTSDDPTIGCCWDADRLDLPRVRVMPRADLLSTNAAKYEVKILEIKSAILPSDESLSL
jgi:uncharacterized protein